jgi:hypothetical protein
MGCHAEHDWTAHDAPVLPKTLGAGQDMNILKGFPGKVYAPNITPDAETGAGSWSDDQLARFADIHSAPRQPWGDPSRRD